MKTNIYDFVDQWIISRFQSTLKEFETALDKFEVNNASKILYSFVWNDFCDWYVELAKNRLYSDNDEVKSAVLTRALGLFEHMLKLLHPFIPFITEEIWNLMDERKDGESISVTGFPGLDESLINPEAEKEMDFVQAIVTGIRNIRGEMSIPPSRKVNAVIKSDSITENQSVYIKSLGKVEELTCGVDIEKPKASALIVIKGVDIYIPLEGIIDLEVESQRIEKEIKRLEGALIGVEKKLGNAQFTDNAPADVVERERAKQHDWTDALAKFKAIFEDLK